MKLNLTNQKIGKLTVIKEYGKSNHGDITWLCICDCGNTLIASSQHLKLKQVKSCGCLERERIEKARSIEHITKRFWSNVKIGKPEECWEWQPNVSINGYGSFRLFINGRWKDDTAHRVAYFLSNGEYPEDMLICHSCDNRKCCNPAHLWKGTYSDNSQDREKKGRGNVPKGENCKRAKLTQEQVDKIRELYSTKKYTQKELGKSFGVCSSTITFIVNYRNWKECGRKNVSNDLGGFE